MHPSELHEWRLQAAFHGVTLSEWIREQCEKAIPKRQPEPITVIPEEPKPEPVKRAPPKPRVCTHGHRAGFKCHQCKGGMAIA